MSIYFVLSPQFQTQCENNSCGLGTLVMVLNGLGADPHRMWKYPWRWYDEQMLDSCLPIEKIQAKGIGFESMICTIRLNGLDVEAVRPTALITLDEFRTDIKRSCCSEDTALIVNYSRGYFNQTGTGHYATLGGYNQVEDLVLVLDPARFKYPPYWVKTDHMWSAMKEISFGKNGYTENMPRGYMLVKKSTSNHFIIRLSSHHKLTLQDDKFMQIIHSWNEWMNNDVTNPTKVLQSAVKKVLMMVEEIPSETSHQNFKDLFLFISEMTSSNSGIYKQVEKLITNINTHASVWQINSLYDNELLINFASNLLLCWPYHSNNKTKTNNFMLSSLVAKDIELHSHPDALSISIQLRFIRDISKHKGHQDTCKSEQVHFR